MALPFREKLVMLMPPPLFYERRISREIVSGEPELGLLAEFVRPAAIAIDGGANQGFFAYALSKLVRRVVAFEPNPDYARFARWMLRGRAEVHEMALSDKRERATFYVPLTDDGTALHFAGNLKRIHSQFGNVRTYDVEVRTLDGFAFDDVCFIKADVEGNEREVLDGARATIARSRPVLLLELLSGTHDDPAAHTAAICEDFGYDAFIVQKGEKLPALPMIESLRANTSWGTGIETRNVLFTPR